VGGSSSNTKGSGGGNSSVGGAGGAAGSSSNNSGAAAASSAPSSNNAAANTAANNATTPNAAASLAASVAARSPSIQAASSPGTPAASSLYSRPQEAPNSAQPWSAASNGLSPQSSVLDAMGVGLGSGLLGRTIFTELFFKGRHIIRFNIAASRSLLSALYDSRYLQIQFLNCTFRSQ
jgi:hypothetical protein